MKMISTPTPVSATQYTNHVYNCLRNRACERSFSAPLPGVPFLQLYVNFGAYKPFTADFELVNHCSGDMEQIFPSNFVIGKDPDGNWYGVFKNFNTPMMELTTFVVWLSTLVETPSGFVEKTFFSQMMMIEPCDPLTKLKACQPENATTTGFDVNGLYYGLPQNVDYLGISSVRYFHIAYVRQGKVRELSNKATFKSSLTRNFRTQFERVHIVDTELVPKWYKDVILAIYLRGAISVDDGPTYLVSDLVMEPINDDDLTWRPAAQLKETVKLYFGCDESACVECCSPTILSATTNGTGGGSGSESSGGPGSSSGSESSPGGGGEPSDPINVNLAFTEPGVCEGFAALVYVTLPATDVATGLIVYTDIGLTTPVTGYSFITNSVGTIFNINSVTGEVGAPTGNVC